MWRHPMIQVVFKNLNSCPAASLMEEFRAPLAGALALNRANHPIVKPADFTYTLQAGCRMSEAYRRRFLTEYSQRLMLPVAALNDHQTMSIAGQIIRQIHRFVQLLFDPKITYEPFLVDFGKCRSYNPLILFDLIPREGANRFS